MFGLVFLLLLKNHGEERTRIKLVLEAIEEVNTHEEWLDILEASELLEKRATHSRTGGGWESQTRTRSSRAAEVRKSLLCLRTA